MIKHILVRAIYLSNVIQLLVRIIDHKSHRPQLSTIVTNNHWITMYIVLVNLIKIMKNDKTWKNWYYFHYSSFKKLLKLSYKKIYMLHDTLLYFVNQKIAKAYKLILIKFIFIFIFKKNCIVIFQSLFMWCNISDFKSLYWYSFFYSNLQFNAGLSSNIDEANIQYGNIEIKGDGIQ